MRVVCTYMLILVEGVGVEGVKELGKKVLGGGW